MQNKTNPPITPIKFVFIKGITDLASGISNYFLDQVQITVSGTVVKTAKIVAPLYVVGYLDSTTFSTESMLVTLLQIDLYKFSLPVQDSTAINMEVPFRLNGALNPTLYRITNP